MQMQYQQPPHNQQIPSGYSMPGSQPAYQSQSGRGFGRSGFFVSQRSGFSAIEWGLILIAMCIVITSFIFGFIQQDTANRDAARLSDIQQVIVALQNFYENSSLDPDERKYPVATCSARLNEVDYELNLRRALTGQQPQLDPHGYIQTQQFPRDASGEYSATNAQRSIAYRCPQNLPDADTDPIYDDWESCNFDQSAGPRHCYLYTSTPNGDTFEIAYYSEADNGFFIFKQFRDDEIIPRFAPAQ